MLAPWHRFLWQVLSQILRLFSRRRQQQASSQGLLGHSPMSYCRLICSLGHSVTRAKEA